MSLIVNNLDSSALAPDTENLVKKNLNDRAIELAKKPDNKQILQKAEELLTIYFGQCNVSEVIEIKTIANIKKGLNQIIYQMVETSEKIETEASRIFKEILENKNPTNIDPVVRMKIESALYEVIVKELSIYGNKEMIREAINLIHDVSNRVPKESPVNDLIMKHNIRQISPVK